MSDFSENVRKAYEQYLLGNKQEAFKLLIPGTKHHYYLSIMDALKRERHAISADTLDMNKQFRNAFYDEDSTRTKIQELFLRFDGAKIDEERDQIIKELDTSFIYGFYNHTKPADIKSKKTVKDKSADKETHLFDQNKYFNEEKFMKKLYSQNGLIYSLHRTLYEKIDFRKISENEFLGFCNSSECFASMTNETFWEKLITTFDQKYKTNKHFAPDQYLYDKFTLEQMEMLGEKIPNIKSDIHYIGKMFEKKFHFELDDENKDTFTLEQRREQLITMYEASTDKPQSFKSALLLEILENGVKMDIYDKNYFIEYLKNPLKNWHMNKETQKKKEIHDHVWNQYMQSLNNRSGGRMDSGLDQKLYKKYLEQFYIAAGDLEAFKDYFDQDFLSNLYEEFEFMTGKEIKKEKIDAKKFENLSNLVLINLLEWNKSVFKKEDRVKLVVEIKNVSTLHVKIFEFNSENYYRKNLAPFRTDVNLDGLVTSHEDTFEFKEIPQKKFRHVFEFPQLDHIVGLFVIEFISNGYSSRAVIKKGSLSLIYKSTVAGQVAYILDENKEICKSEKTGMWYKNQYFKADPEKGGRIVIPYEKNSSNDKTILINDGFAQLTEFRRMSESYSFDVAYIVQPESLLMGKESEILLKPVVKVNDRRWNISILKNTKVTLTTTSFIDNLPVTKTFENLELDNKHEIPIRFQVPPNLQTVSIIIEAEVKNISKGTNDKLSHSHIISMDTKWNSLCFYESYLRKLKNDYYYYIFGKNGESYLRKLKNDYYYYIFGKNGEPLDDVTVNFTFTHKFFSNQSENVSLTTDEEGKINLGSLEDISYLNTNFNGPNGACTSSHNISNIKERVSMPDSLNILEDEEIQLPYLSNTPFSQSSVWLVSFSSSYKVIRNWFDKISFSHDKGYEYGRITISGLERGSYNLYLNATGESIPIKVHKGVYWESDSFILKNHSLVEKREKTNIIRIKDILLEEEKDQGHTLSFNIEDYGKNARAHVFAHTFLQEDMNTLFTQVENVGRDWASLDIFPFAKWENIYLSNRKLGDEFRYVFDRKFVKRFMGNTLDRPQLLLNRYKLRETQFDQEVVGTGNQYEEVKESAVNYDMRKQNIAGPSTRLARNMAPMMEHQRFMPQSVMMQNIAPMAYSNSNINVNYSNSYGGNYGCPTGSFKSFQNFLNNSSWIISNLTPNEKGHITCSFDASKYSTVLILVIDENTVSQLYVDVHSSLEMLEKRDLSLSNPLNPTKYYNEMRNSEILRKGDDYGIEDITSTNYIMIDSIERVNQVQKEIRKTIGAYATDDLSFLVKWNTFTHDEKNKKYSQYVCHEVNLFLFFKDPEYFKTVVRPFISNKMEKSFIDLWLVGDRDAVVKYKNIELLDRLNTLEKCLLISEVVKDSKEEAKVIADRIKLLSDQKELKIDVVKPDGTHNNSLIFGL